MSHIHALNGYFISQNKIDKCTYVKCFYHALFFTIMFQLPSRSSSS